MLRSLLCVGLLAGVASAQPAPAPPAAEVPAAPGAPATAAPPETPPTSGPPSTVQPPPAPPPAHSRVMDNRWAVGFDLGWESLKIQHGDQQKVTFGVIELAGRFRIRPAIEVGLSAWAGGTAGDIGIGGLYASFRYRFLAEQPWNVYAIGALGVISVAQKMASDNEKQGRGSLRLAVGAERRFGFGLAVHADLGLATIAENTKAPDAVMLSTAGQLSRYHLGGGTLMIGVTYYF